MEAHWLFWFLNAIELLIYGHRKIQLTEFHASYPITLNFLCSQVLKVQLLEFQVAQGWIHLPRGEVQNPMYIFSLLRNVEIIHRWCWTDWWEAAQRIVGMEEVSPESWIEQTASLEFGTRTRSLFLWSAAKHQAKMSRTINSKNKPTEKHSVSHSCVLH